VERSEVVLYMLSEDFQVRYCNRICGDSQMRVYMLPVEELSCNGVIGTAVAPSMSMTSKHGR
jgi:hypothetical protein